ncbi:MAG: hypothetical protein QW057_03240 [Candidatus Bathyarchaeia archaeon]
MGSSVEYRDKTCIRKDVIPKLVQYGTLNQTALLSYCGLNLQKHKRILEELEERGLIAREETMRGKKQITLKATAEGVSFCKRVLEPYEAMFPRAKKS